MFKTVEFTNMWNYTKELFHMFALMPLLISIIGIMIMVVFNMLEFKYYILDLTISFVGYNLAWWFLFGTRKKNLHQGSE